METLSLGKERVLGSKVQAQVKRGPERDYRIWRMHPREKVGSKYKGHNSIGHMTEDCSGWKSTLNKGVDEVDRADELYLGSVGSA